MNVLIIYKSIHHGNTEKIAKVMADTLEAELLDLKDVNADIIKEYDLIGFGSGIYYSKPHKELMELIDNVNPIEKKKAFVFSTSGRGKMELNNLLKDKLSKKGFEVIAEFSCKGFDTVGPFKLIGGINKGRPNEEDFKNAKSFAEGLKKNNIN